VPESTISQQLRAFVLEVFYLTDPDELTDDTSLIRSGIVDSTGMLDIILFIEGEYGISVADTDTIPENFETIALISAYVERKRQPSVV
jgi:acyl carrier protein